MMIIVRVKHAGSIYSMISHATYLLVGGRDKISAYDWNSLCGADKRGEDTCWELMLPGRGEVNSMETLGEARLVVGAGDTNVLLLDLETRAVVRTYSGHSGFIHSVDTSSDKILVSGGEEGEVRVWDLSQSECVHSMKPSDTSDLSRPKLGVHVSSVAVNNDWLACGGGPAPAIWHLKSLTMATALPCNNNEVKVVRFWDDNVFVGGRGRTLFQFNCSGDLKAEVEVTSSVIYDVVIQHNPNLMCCSGSSSYIDILSNNYTYKDATIDFFCDQHVINA